MRQPRCAQLTWFGFGKLGQQRVQHLHVVGRLERGGRDERNASDLGQREFELAQAIGGIDGDENKPGLGGGKLRQRPFRTIERPNADARATFEPEREKAGSQRIDPLRQFLPGPLDPVARRNQRVALAPPARGIIETSTNGDPQQWHIGCTANITVRYLGHVCSPCIEATRVGKARRKIRLWPLSWVIVLMGNYAWQQDRAYPMISGVVLFGQPRFPKSLNIQLPV